MAETEAADDLNRLTRAGYSPTVAAGYTHWVRDSTGEVASLEELAGVLMGDRAGGLSWVAPRLAAAGRLAMGDR